MNVLIVGAGALGQVFGLHLLKGGASVSYLVKPQQKERTGGGFHLFRLKRWGQPEVERFEPVEVFTDSAELRQKVWDAIWLCVPSTALRGTWLASLREHSGAATAVSIGQDAHDHAVLQKHWDDAQIVQVVPAFLAYQAPLADEPLPGSGIAYWRPPMATFAVSGAPERVDPLVATLRRGGIPARRASGGAGEGALMAALTMPYIAALEAAGWSLKVLRERPRLRLAGSAARQAAAAVAALHGRRPPTPGLATSPWLTSLVLRVLPTLVPFDIERYSRVHFTKVGAQTRQMLAGWIAEGRSRGLPVDGIEALQQLLDRQAQLK